MGYFFCPTCNDWWGSWTPESVAEHNVQHTLAVKKLYEETAEEDTALAEAGLAAWAERLDKDDEGE